MKALLKLVFIEIAREIGKGIVAAVREYREKRREKKPKKKRKKKRKRRRKKGNGGK